MIIYIGFIIFGLFSVINPKFWAKDNNLKPGQKIEDLYKQYRIMGIVFIIIGIFFILFTK